MKIERGYLRTVHRAHLLETGRVLTPATFRPPPRVGNWEYFLPPENQGPQPWCAAFAQCAILQAAAWRHPDYGYPVQFDEEKLYREAKKIDGDNEDGTSLESVIQASGNVFGAFNDIRSIEADDIPWAIHQYGAAIVGLMIHESWNTPRKDDGLVTIGGRRLGGHAVDVSWYDLEEQRVGGPNWWGMDWGEHGHWSMTMKDFASCFLAGYVQKVVFTKELT
jgi:hypothetical protein